jgi:hypothetical protein
MPDSTGPDLKLEVPATADPPGRLR